MFTVPMELRGLRREWLPTLRPSTFLGILLKDIILLQDDIKYLGQIFRADKHSSQVQML